MSGHDYCYFLANAADVFNAFKDYGWRLFDLNLRYEIRNSSVNGNIINTLKHPKTRKYFHHYNNGLIIVCQRYVVHDDVRDNYVSITNAQVVNGLQTIKSIYNAVTTNEVKLSELEEDCRIQVKVIRNDEAAFVSNVVQATNNQNPMTARNLKSNAKEQKILRQEFSSIEPKWFFQVKQGEWDSLTQDSGRFFKSVVGHPPGEFKPDQTRKSGRVLDNQDAAKAWLAFIGFSDWAGDRTTHYFAKDEIYDVAFRRCPTPEHWTTFRKVTDFREHRTNNLQIGQATAYQYLLAYFIWEFIRHFIPSPMRYREQALQEGVRDGKITRADGSITSPVKVQEDYLSENHSYQTWRLMANMKEVLVEIVSFMLAQKYDNLGEDTCRALLTSFDAKQFVTTGEVKDVATVAASKDDLPSDAVFSRMLGFLHFVSGQYWEDKRSQMLSVSRVRTLLLRPDMIAAFKAKALELEKRKALDRPWKPAGITFVESLPTLSKRP
jgi:hypothetical protein